MLLGIEPILKISTLLMTGQEKERRIRRETRNAREVETAQGQWVIVSCQSRYTCMISSGCYVPGQQKYGKQVSWSMRLCIFIYLEFAWLVIFSNSDSRKRQMSQVNRNTNCRSILGSRTQTILNKSPKVAGVFLELSLTSVGFKGATCKIWP